MIEDGSSSYTKNKGTGVNYLAKNYVAVSSKVVSDVIPEHLRSVQSPQKKEIGSREKHQNEVKHASSKPIGYSDICLSVCSSSFDIHGER